MYSTRSGLTLGFHGCDISVFNSVVNGTAELSYSENSFDWLGNGIYFWEYSPDRALEYAQSSGKRQHASNITTPAVLGAVLDLGHCLDLIEYKNLRLLKDNYDLFKDTQIASGFILPKNKHGGSVSDLLLRDLDCAVIEFLHQSRIELGLKPYDSVKGVFLEGDNLYPDAGFKEKNHIQVCIRNPNCIKGFFVPRTINNGYPGV